MQTVCSTRATFSDKASSLQFSASKYTDPIAELAQFVDVPLRSESEAFSPTLAHMRVADALFSDKSGDAVRFVKAVVSPKDAPDLGGVPEIAFLGYSNVGKSSLIKALFHRCAGARVLTSKRPGHTKTVNYFSVHDRFVLVDMPGYGLAQPDTFDGAVGGFLAERRSLRESFLLVSAEEGMRREDEMLMEYLDRLSVLFTVVLTKVDLCRKAERVRRVVEVGKLRTRFEHCSPQVFLVSSRTGEGVGFLQAYVAHLCSVFEE